MKNRMSCLLLFVIVIFACLSFPLVPFAAEYIYVTNEEDDTVSVIDAYSNNVIDTISVGDRPGGITANPSGSRAYVANKSDNTVSVIDTATKTVTTTIAVGIDPEGIAINPAGSLVYVLNVHGNNASVIDTSSNTVSATILLGNEPWGITVNPSGNHAYATNDMDDTVSVIDTVNNTVIATIPVGDGPLGIAVNPGGTEAYVANESDNTVSVIDTATYTVTRTIPNVGMTGIAVNPAGTEVWTGNGEDLVLIDSNNYMVIHTIKTGSGYDCIAFNNSGSRVYVTNEYANTVSVIDTASNSVIKTIPVGRSPFWIAVVQDSEPTKGDIDGNGEVDLYDSVMTIKVLSGVATNSYVYQRADINGDNKIGLEEAIYILQKAAGIE
ncbi:MAG: beta-propeller fold lactonase family protein [Candidatus Thermoplasmatota archaeon]|nr:beta-propeller fold lactonase family protein [Candidatus Thermoplasmatota archaeon]